MPALTQEAANKALLNYTITGDVDQKIIVQGLKFQVPINLKGSVVTAKNSVSC